VKADGDMVQQSYYGQSHNKAWTVNVQIARSAGLLGLIPNFSSNEASTILAFSEMTFHLPKLKITIRFLYLCVARAGTESQPPGPTPLSMPHCPNNKHRDAIFTTYASSRPSVLASHTSGARRNERKRPASECPLRLHLAPFTLLQISCNLVAITQERQRSPSA
jgi:hypothetical protein